MYFHSETLVHTHNVLSIDSATSVYSLSITSPLILDYGASWFDERGTSADMIFRKEDYETGSMIIKKVLDYFGDDNITEGTMPL